MTADFFRPECLEPPIVLRLRLERFTLGHFLLLCELDSPYRPDEPAPDLDGIQFMVAVFICAHRQDEAMQQFCRWWVKVFFRFWSWSCRKLTPDTEREAFRLYLQSAVQGPKVTPKTTNTRPSAAPSVYRLLRFAMEELHQSYAVALDMPLDRLMSLWAAHADYHCGVSVWDDRRNDLWEHATKMAKQRSETDAAG